MPVDRWHHTPIVGQDWSGLNVSLRRLDQVLNSQLFFQQFLPVFNVKVYGARGDGIVDDYAAITAAIAAAIAAGGGVVLFPTGTYLTSATIVVPGADSTRSIVLRGLTMRDTYIRPTVNGVGGIRFGTDTPDPSGTSTNDLSYCGMEDLSVTGVATDGTGIGVQFTQMQRGWIKNCIIEEFDGAGGIGLYLRGSTTTGVGAAAAPHVWRCRFDHIQVSTTQRPLVLENVDECDFIGCNWGNDLGAGSQRYAVEILQGHNNRFWGGLASGDSGAARPNYRGFGFRSPTKGDNIGHLLDGVVAEGYKHMIWIEGATVQSLRGYQLNASLCEFRFYNGVDDGTSSGERGNNVELDFVDLNEIRYRAGREIPSEPITFADADTSPTVRASNVFACANTGATAITTFDDARYGQLIVVRLDANTTLVDSSGLRLWGRANLTGATEMWVALIYIGFWYMVGPPAQGSTGGTFTIPMALTVSAATSLGNTLSVSAATTLGGALSVAGATMLGNTLTVSAATTLKSTLDVGATVRVSSNAAAALDMFISRPDQQTGGLNFATAGSNRWGLYVTEVAETGSDAGSNFRLRARTDAGAFLDDPLTIVRAAGGALASPRPVSLGSTLSVSAAATIKGALSVAGAATFGSTVSVSAQAIFLQDLGTRYNNHTDGAGAAAGTLLNAPVAGNPAFWLPVSIAGTTRYIPCW